MVHIGDIHEDHPAAIEVTRLLLSEILTRGDIITHATSHRVGALLSDPSLLYEAQQARERGVWFDGGVGRSNFSFLSARDVIESGFMPDSISSDATAAGRSGLVHSLTECMGKFLAVGLSVEQVVGLVTSGPARILGESDKIGGLREGSEADVSVLEVIEGDWLFRDITGATASSSIAIVPTHTVRAGSLIPLSRGPRPWGWAPESR